MGVDWLTRVAELRRDYSGATFDTDDLAPTWLAQFTRWLEDAIAAGLLEPNAMVLATAGTDARPGARTVLLKDFDERGFVFFTNLESAKARQIAANPRAALVFPWLDLARQIVVEGAVASLDPSESDAYFATRPRGARISAHASPQSQVIGSRAELVARHAEVEARHPGEVPRPASWGGLRVVPDRVEFWQGRPDRLHDRLHYRRDEGEDRWLVERLAP